MKALFFLLFIVFFLPVSGAMWQENPNSDSDGDSSGSKTISYFLSFDTLINALPNLIKNGISDGFNSSMMTAADNLGGQDASIYQSLLLLSPNPDMWFTQDESKSFNSFWFSVAYFLFVCGGTIYIMLKKKGIDQGKSGFENDYVYYVIGGLILFLFNLYGLKFLFTFEWLLSQGITLSVTDAVSNVQNNPLLYLINAIFLLGIKLFLVMRFLVIFIAKKYFLLLVVACFVPVIGAVARTFLVFSGVLLFFKVFLAVVYVGGVQAIKALIDMNTSMDPYIHGKTEFLLTILPYIGLLVLILFLILIFTVMPIAYVLINMKRRVHT